MGAYQITRRASLLAAAGLTAIPITAGTAHALSAIPADNAGPDLKRTVRRTPYDYGADLQTEPGDNQQKAVQAMLDDCIASWNAQAGRFARLPDLADRTWNVGTGVRINNLRQPGFMLRN